jgi:TolB protein
LDCTSVSVRIADTLDYEVSPSFSSDGQRIVYAAGVPGDRADHIFTTGVDGNSRVQLTDLDANDTSPRFSPDGSRIVFARDKTYIWGGLAANWENGGVICVINADGTGERQLTPDDVFAHTPAFSPDGNSVIYFTLHDAFSIPVDGAAQATRIGPAKSYANFSPDGTRMVYSDGKYSPDHELFISHADGTQQAQITTSANGCFHGVFDSSGKNIYFLMEEWPEGPSGVPKSSIWTVNADGSGQTQLTDLSLFDTPTGWKPQESPSPLSTSRGTSRSSRPLFKKPG